MHLPPDAARRYQQFITAAWLATDYSRHDLMAQAGIGEERRNAFVRSFQAGKSPLEIAEARRIIEVIAGHPVLHMDSAAVWDWVMGRIPMPKTVHELFICMAFQPRRMIAQCHVLAEFEAKAIEQVAYSTLPKLSALPEEIVRIIHRNCTRLIKFGDSAFGC